MRFTCAACLRSSSSISGRGRPGHPAGRGPRPHYALEVMRQWVSLVVEDFVGDRAGLADHPFLLQYLGLSVTATIFTAAKDVVIGHAPNLAAIRGHFGLKGTLLDVDCGQTRLVIQITFAAIADGSFIKYLERVAKVDLLILDDWGLGDLDKQAYVDLLEVLDDRCQKRATLITSQLPVSHWHERVGSPTVADALLDRLAPKALQLNLKGESLR